MKIRKHILLLPVLLLLACAGMYGLGNHWTAGESEGSFKLPPTDYTAFQAGEELTYALQFNKISAGEAKLKVHEQLKEIADQKHFDVEITGRSFAIFDPFYKVRDYYESFIHTKTLMPTAYIRDVQEGGYEKKESYIFNHQKNTVLSQGKEFNVADNMHDIISAFYYLRCIDFSKQKVGTFYPIKIFFEEETLDLGVKYTGKTVLNTKLGRISCYVFRPRLAEGRVFKDQSDMVLYVTADRNQLPVRIESGVYLGTVRAELKSYSGLKFPFTAKASD